ncbi:hypothetical protein YPPY103_3065, partial [Yersinia pestis PY-103]
MAIPRYRGHGWRI